MDIKVLIIEVTHFIKELEGGRSEFEKFMDEIGYKLYMNHFIDDIYIKKDFEFPKNFKAAKPQKP